MIQLSKEQKEIIAAPLWEKTLVMAAAASGKTLLVAERAKYVLEKDLDPSKVVLLTFTNNAGEEMSNRIDPKYRDGLFVGTMHSYANFLLSSYGIDTSQILNEEEFDDLFDLIYENPKVIPPLDYLIVDESQDLNGQQFDFIEILNPKGLLIVGDVRQSIYAFKNATPDRLLSLMRNDEFTVRELTENYRNSKVILEASNRIVGQMHGISLRKSRGMVENPGLIKSIRKSDIPHIIKKDGDWGDWAILCRSNKNLHNMLMTLKSFGIPCNTFRQAQGSLDNLNVKIKENAVKVLTTHSAKGLEFPKVIILDYLGQRSQEDIRINYVSVTRAKDELYIVGK